MEEDQKHICKNCGKDAHGKYCASCGQRTSVSKVTFRETIHDLVDTLFTIDAPLLTTLKLLLVNPGTLFTEYINGKRKKYYRPVTFFILMTLIYLVVRSIINFDPFGSTILSVNDPSGGQLATEARNYMLFHIDKLLFAFVFTLGLLMKLFFYNKNSLAEFFAISFYLLGIYTILTIFNMFYIQYIDKTFQALHILLMLFYFTYAMVSFFSKNKILVILKSVFVYILAFFFYGFLAFGLSFIIVLIKNN